MKFDINLDNTRQTEELDQLLAEVKQKIEQRINLDKYTNNIQPVVLNKNTLFRTLLLVGLSDNSERKLVDIDSIKLSANSARYQHVFNKQELNDYITLLMKMRYAKLRIDLSQPNQLSKVLGYELLRGRDILLSGNTLDEWFNFTPTGGNRKGGIPQLLLNIGQYDNGMDAVLDINNIGIPNTQMVIAGSTGSGKTNLLVRVINQLRELTTDTAYPTNFLLFDYQGEFSDVHNAGWLDDMQISPTAILDPTKNPLPFNPFKDLSGKTMNEINIEASTLAAALIAIFGARVSANMDAYLREGINNAYKESRGLPISFEAVLKHYNKLNDNKVDTVANSLRSMVSAHMFAEKDDIDLINNSFIINLGQYPKGKDGSLAKAIIYFTLEKLNSIYETLTPQDKDDDRVEIRHFTIIDEAHYMLSFNNQPLKNLVAVGRNKGMSIILASQDMNSFKTEHFDFYVNAYFPIIMRQQQINTTIISGLFGGNSNETKEIYQEISNLKLGEAIIKNNEFDVFGGKRYKKVKVTKMI